MFEKRWRHVLTVSDDVSFFAYFESFLIIYTFQVWNLQEVRKSWNKTTLTSLNNYNSKSIGGRSINVYVCYVFFKNIFISYRFCLHPLHLIGWFFPMYLHCLRSFFFFFFFFFFRARDLLIFLNTGLVYIGSYVFALYIFVTHIERCIWFFYSSQLYALVSICSTYLGGFHIYFYCARLSLWKIYLFFFSLVWSQGLLSTSDNIFALSMFE